VARARKVNVKNQSNDRRMLRAARFREHRSIAELAADQQAKPLSQAQDLAADLWESRQDLEAFLTDVYHARDAGVA